MTSEPKCTPPQHRPPPAVERAQMAAYETATYQNSAVGRQVRDMHAATGMRLCIDADCPGCGWPERWFNGDLFGCNKCDYTSTDRIS